MFLYFSPFFNFFPPSTPSTCHDNPWYLSMPLVKFGHGRRPIWAFAALGCRRLALVADWKRSPWRKSVIYYEVLLFYKGLIYLYCMLLWFIYTVIHLNLYLFIVSTYFKWLWPLYQYFLRRFESMFPAEVVLVVGFTMTTTVTALTDLQLRMV